MAGKNNSGQDSSGQDKQVISITDLANLPSREIDVYIEADENNVWHFPCRMLTHGRFQELGRLCEDPTPPAMGGPKGKVYDYADPVYLRKRQEAEDRRLYIRLAEFIQVDIPGDTLQEKADYIAEKLPMGVLRGLSQAMQQTVMGGDVRVETRAKTFHSA